MTMTADDDDDRGGDGGRDYTRTPVRSLTSDGRRPRDWRPFFLAIRHICWNRITLETWRRARVHCSVGAFALVIDVSFFVGSRFHEEDSPGRECQMYLVGYRSIGHRKIPPDSGCGSMPLSLTLPTPDLTVYLTV